MMGVGRSVPFDPQQPSILRKANSVAEMISQPRRRDIRRLGDKLDGVQHGGDTKLAPATTKLLGHFIYPYAEGAKGALEYYDPQNFQYSMNAREVKI